MEILYENLLAIELPQLIMWIIGAVLIYLAIVKEIIQRHHGTVTAENGRDGLRMTISMPMLDRNLTNS